MQIDPWPDGTIEIQQKSDMLGRMMQRGRHTNAGYSGYYTGYIWKGGKRRKLKDFWRLFPNQEHHFPKQADRGEAQQRIQSAVDGTKGKIVTKAAGGWFIFDPQTVAQ